ncbi:MAG: hypothetical protein JWN83_1774 [Chitinophagaceae bacterium]|nr:hypothetical protein [Chitinophagaceae bacterium]
METMINLNDLLKHEILDLYSAEEQIIEAMPAMIEKAKNPELKKALREHLKITEEQKGRLDKVKQTFGEEDGQGNGENKGFFSRLFGGRSGGEKCRGMEGLITEGEKIMAADITDEALDAAIIASAQKIEHYEISGYGTARAFARELQLAEVERLLTQTLNEEYKADDLLTSLAVGKLNLEAEQADGMNNNGNGRSGNSDRSSGGNGTGGNSPGGRGSSSKGKTKSSAGSSSRSSSSQGSSKSSGSKGVFSKTGSKSSAGISKGSSSRSSSKSSSKSSGGRGTSSKGAAKSSPKSSKSSAKASSSRSASKGGNKASKSKGAKRATSRGR